MRWGATILATAISLVAIPGLAEEEQGRVRYGPEYQACAERDTAGIIQCVGERTRTWDRRLNKAYQALITQTDGEQRNRLRGAQRLWISYRNANCAWYGGGEGTITAVEAAECRRSMTEQRARELEEAASP